MLAPIKGRLVLTQLFGSMQGGPSEAYKAIRNGVSVRCIAHPALDINCPTGTEVFAVKGGTVTHAVPDDPFLGGYIILTDALGGQYHFAHLSAVQVTNGQEVLGGQRIGLSGATGNVTGPHLHFAVRDPNPNFRNGFDGFIDPLPRFNFDVGPLIDCSFV